MGVLSFQWKYIIGRVIKYMRNIGKNRVNRRVIEWVYGILIGKMGI